MLDVAVVGGGPGGLFLARLLMLRGIARQVTVHERDAPDATFGFGVVFSDRTMSAFERADPVTHRRIAEAGVAWTDMELRHRGRALRYGGYGFTAVSRKTLLAVLQEQAADAGAELRFEERADALALIDGHDLVVAADGANSATRGALADRFGTRTTPGAGKYVWFGTRAPFEVVTFPLVQTAFGAFAAHAYPYGEGLHSFIVETDEATWRATGLETSTERAAAPGVSDPYAQELMEQVFAEQLQGHPLLVNNSKWATFRHITNRAWSHRNLVLLGDAAHTAHFSVGSGTKMAMEDAIGLAAELAARGAGVGSEGVESALARYESRRRPETERTQRWALPSMRWWETFGSRMDRDADRFGFHFLTRTDAIGLAGLRRRHPERIAAAEEAYAHDAPRTETPAPGGHALGAPLHLGGVLLRNRLVTVAGDRAERQIRLCEGHSVAGSSLVLADWRRPVGAGECDAWRAALERVSLDGGVLGVVLRAFDTAAADRAEAVGFPFVEVVLDLIAHPSPAEAAEHALLERKFLGSLPAGSALIAGLHCPAAGAYGAVEGDGGLVDGQVVGGGAQFAQERVHVRAVEGDVGGDAAHHSGVLFVMSLHFQQGLGYTAMAAGLVFLPLTLPTAFNPVYTGRLVAKKGPRIPSILGFSLMTVGALIQLAFVGGDGATHYALTAAGLLVFGFGVSFAIPSLVTTLVSSVPKEQAGIASGALNSARQTGAVVGVAVLGSVLHASPGDSGTKTALAVAAAALAAGALLAVGYIGRRTAQ
ncbi:MFS transporter [Streptomyces sp. NPDC006704]|uniref:MFS transporter n=1 Tax=Streptomyces sp. NPDC006704 TaxID=3364760 RepID=UPI0036A8DBB0